MKKIITIVGARPQFIKAAATSRAFRDLYAEDIQELILHSGQHYDHNMSSVFFQELEIDEPTFRLQIKGSSHGAMTGEILAGIEAILLEEKPDAVIVFGDTNTTLAGALAASKLLIPVIHIEAGLRSGNKTMPEEQNRILTDHLSTLLFCPSQIGINNLVHEGFDLSSHPNPTADKPNLYMCGDVMLDNALYFGSKGDVSILSELGLKDKDYVLATVHRNTNTDDPHKLSSILKAFLALAATQMVLLPLHPRTKKMLDLLPDENLKQAIEEQPNLRIIPPASYLEICALLAHCNLVITDSGGLQKEAYYFSKPCLVLRPETEWLELLGTGTCLLSGTEEMEIISKSLLLLKQENLLYPPLFGDGKAAEVIVKAIAQELLGLY